MQKGPLCTLSPPGLVPPWNGILGPQVSTPHDIGPPQHGPSLAVLSQKLLCARPPGERCLLAASFKPPGLHSPAWLSWHLEHNYAHPAWSSAVWSCPFYHISLRSLYAFLSTHQHHYKESLRKGLSFISVTPLSNPTCSTLRMWLLNERMIEEQRRVGLGGSNYTPLPSDFWTTRRDSLAGFEMNQKTSSVLDLKWSLPLEPRSTWASLSSLFLLFPHPLWGSVFWWMAAQGGRHTSHKQEESRRSPGPERSGWTSAPRPAPTPPILTGFAGSFWAGGMFEAARFSPEPRKWRRWTNSSAQLKLSPSTVLHWVWLHSTGFFFPACLWLCHN